MDLQMNNSTFRNQVERALNDSLDSDEKGMLKETFHLDASVTVTESQFPTVEELTEKFQDETFSKALRKLRQL